MKKTKSKAHIEVFDDKISAMIRRKATNMENAESKLWDIWFRWTNTIRPEEFSNSYNRQYYRRELESELQ